MALTMAEIVERASRDMRVLVGQPVAGVISCAPNEKGWRCVLETLERKAVPDTSDLLACYVLDLDADGNIMHFHRLRVRRRGQMVEEELPEAAR